jgi:tetratricopeptide (TPR) repeat protein
MHCRIAKTMAFVGRYGELAEGEWNKAIELAETSGEKEKLQELYYQFALSLSNIRLMDCQPVVLQLAEKYLSMDSSNYKMHACLGVARLDLDDSQGAIESLTTALALEPRDQLVARALFHTFRIENDFEGIMKLLENDDDMITSGRVRAFLEEERMQGILFFAARETGKMDFLTKCYETEISRGWTEPSISEEDDPRNDSIWSEIDSAIGVFNTREGYSGGTALLMCWLGLFYKEYQGDLQNALRLWTTVFLQQSEVFKLGDLSSQYSMTTVPKFIGLFAESLYDEALKSHGLVDEVILKMLERLRQRHDAFQDLDAHGASLYNEKNINLFLAKLYLQNGRDGEATELLNEQFQRGIEILKDDIDWNDHTGYHTLSKIMFAVGQKENATIAQCLRRFVHYQPEEQKYDEIRREEEDDDGSKKMKGAAGVANIEEKEGEAPHTLKEGEDGADGADDGDGDKDYDDDEGPPCGIVERWGHSGWLCSMRNDCFNHKASAPDTPTYVCMTCIQVQFCEDCYSRHSGSTINTGADTSTGASTNDRNRAGKDFVPISICHSRHEHIRIPWDEWRLKGDIMTVKNEEIPVRTWLEALHI